MKSAKLFVCMAGAAMLMPMIARAQFELEHFYVKFDAGGNWTRDVDLKEFFGPVAPGSKIELDPGLRVGLAAGYDFTDWFAAELSLGFNDNRVDEVTGAWVADAWLGSVPFMFNVKLQLPNRSPIAPYVGAGVGGAAVYMDINDLYIGNTGVWGSESDVVFAYQGFAGVRVALNKRMGISVEYRYMWADAPDFEADFRYYYGGSNRFRLGEIQTQSVSLAFDWHF